MISDSEGIEAIEYVSRHILSDFGMRVLLECTWNAAQKIQRRRTKKDVQRLILLCGSTGHGKAQRVALQRVLEAIDEAK